MTPAGPPAVAPSLAGNPSSTSAARAHQYCPTWLAPHPLPQATTLTCDARERGLRHAGGARQPGGKRSRQRQLHVLAQLLLVVPAVPRHPGSKNTIRPLEAQATHAALQLNRHAPAEQSARALTHLQMKSTACAATRATLGPRPGADARLTMTAARLARSTTLLILPSAGGRWKEVEAAGHDGQFTAGTACLKSRQMDAHLASGPRVAASF